MEYDKELKAIEASIQQQTAKMMNHVGASGSLDSLIQVIRCLRDTNHNVVHVLVGSKHDIIGSHELRDLLSDYFSCSHKILEFLNTLHALLHGGQGVSWRLNRIKTAIHDFKSDKTKTGVGRKLLQRALNGFMDVINNPTLANELRAKLREVMDEQLRLYDHLRPRMDNIHHKNMERFHLYRKMTIAVLASAYIGLMVCAAVTAALSPASVSASVAVLAAIAAMNPIDYMTKGMNQVCDKYEEKMKRRSELINALMEANTRVTLDDLEGIRLVVHPLLDKIQSSSPVNLMKDTVLNTMIKDLGKKIDEFAKSVNNLECEKNKCYKDVTDARAKIIGTNFGRN